MADPIYKDAKEHIMLLANDYKCYDNRITHEEALELGLILEGVKVEKPKRAHWLKDFKNSVMCTNCEQQFNWENYSYNRDEWINNTYYCPFCGAMMEGEG